MKGDHIYFSKGCKYQLRSTYTVFVGILPLKEVRTQYLALSTTGWLTIFDSYAWDGPSGPTIDTPSAMRGSLVHDALYQLIRLELIDECYRGKADQLLHDICEEDSMITERAATWKEMVGMFAAGAARHDSEAQVLIAP